MAKKVFYNRRYKMPGWAQPYAVWAVIAFVTLVIVFFTSVERISTENAPALTATPNAFSEGLFYELREAEPGEKYDIAVRYAERLKKKYGFTVRESVTPGCRVVQLMRNNSAPWSVAAALQNGQDRGIYSVLVFLDRLLGSNADAAVSALLIFPRKGCAPLEVLRNARSARSFQVFLDTENGTAPHDRIGALGNLNLRRHFPSAYLMPERTHWANILSLTATGSEPGMLSLPVAQSKDSLAEALAANPLLRHPVIGKADFVQLTTPVALYIGSNTQLHKGGLGAIAVLIWLLAVIPWANALGTFRERLDLGSALTSGILYGLAFASYLLLLKLALKFISSDLSVITVLILLVPAVFFPLRVLQKTMLRAELNRPGLHLLVQLALSIALFVAPISALIGLLQLVAASGFARATFGRKLLRLLVVVLPLAVLFFLSREPMGNIGNFLNAYLPALSAGSLIQLTLLCLVGGNLTALLFVPRERI